MAWAKGRPCGRRAARVPVDRAARGPIPRPLGLCLEPIYAAVVAARNRSFDRGRGVSRAVVPIISIGNLSVGGTGKTPMVMWVARRLIEAGRRPAIALRGYMPEAGADSDEAAEYRAALPIVPLAVGPKRADSLARLRAADDFDCAILDDGFQHRQLARELDVVLIDATRSPFADRLLPVGWLREPVQSLRRAGAVVLTHAESAEPAELEKLRGSVRSVAPDALLVVAKHQWDRLDVSTREEPVSWLAGRRVALVSAVGNPAAFAAMVRAAGAEVAAEARERDHHAWSAADVARLARQFRQSGPIDAILTTSKDWMKLALLNLSAWPAPVARPRLGIEFMEGSAALLERVTRAIDGRR